MSEFVGRTGSNRVYSYPEPRRSGDPLTAFARNYAFGPATDVPVVTGGTEIVWNTVDVPGGNPADVPITPRSTGVIRIACAIVVLNSDIGPENVFFEVLVDGTPVATQGSIVTIDAAPAETSGFEAVPLLVELTGLAIGTTVNVRIRATTFVNGVVFLQQNRATIDVQEVSVATG
jgi:hypothetical protein